ncbi:conjugal transfer protein TraG [Rodentibacter sp. JRC1]|uniref:conjugal transfer protein TraG N-terminal domain-containing protein n=1 Tax=Rodentibacter sp. JRC1 TaxID=2874504 RepID=UPI001CFF3CE3|nr:conjugal transfer protein TraG N-terminal domain-containing protein [Rodentibacter sp. JRC1]GJI56967.1 conjugal transfer protein TraG [Rodentibacter sp. JRC1]
MAMEIVVLDGVDILAQAFNAVAAFVNNDTWFSLIKIAEFIGVFTAAILYIKGRDLRTMFYWLFGFVLINAILLTPKERIIIRDLANPTVVKTINNVPLGVAFPLYLSTKVGYAIAQTYDLFFSSPADVQYTKTGLLFGQRLLGESFYLKPSDETLSSNLNHYIQSCVIERNMIKGSNSFNALMNNKALVNTLYAGSASDYVKFTQNGTTSLQSCATAGRAIATEMNKYASSQSPIRQLMSSLGLKSSNPASLNEYNNKISNIQQYFMKSSKSASEIYTQNMLVNSYRRALERYPASLDGSAELIAQASEQSLTKMKLAHQSSYQVAGKTLPALHTVFLTLMIGIFPIMVLAMFIREVAWGVIKNYLSVLFSLMMWPVLFAVFNSIITTLTAHVMNGEEFTLQNMDKVKENATTIAGMAMWLMLSIPFLSFKLVTNLGQNIASAGSYLGNMLASSTSADAANTAAGNYNWGNMQMNNINGNKVDLNSVYRDGMSTIQLANGATQTMTADGSMVLDSTGSISKLPFSFDSGRMLDASLTSSVQALQRQSEQFMQGYRSSVTNAHDSASQILRNYSHQDLIQKGLTESDINALKNTAQENHGASTRDSATDSTRNLDSTLTNRVNSTGGGIRATASAEASGGFTLFGNGATAKAGVQGEVNTSYQIHDANNEEVSKSKDSAYTYSKDDSWNTSQLAEKTRQLSEINTSHVQDSQLRSLIQNTQDSMRSAYENFSGFTATQSRERVLSEAANLTESQRLNIQHRLEQEFVDYARTRLGDENVGNILTSGSAEAREIRTELINEYAAQFEASLRNIHDGNGVRVLGSQGRFSGGNAGQVENYVGSQGRNFEEEASNLGIKTDPIVGLDPHSERNGVIRQGYDVQAGANKVMANDAEKFADNREKSNNKRFDEKD